jgi:pimeloyl-ACP methyl ester carboxylesterase
MAGLITPMRYYSESFFERTAAGAYGGKTGRDHSARRRMMVVRHRHPPSAYGYAMQLLGTVGWSSWSFLPTIPHDTLVISGDDDPLIPVINAQTLARHIPRARLEIVQGGGHLFLWDEAPRLAAQISRFINAPAPRGEGLNGHFALRPAS